MDLSQLLLYIELSQYSDTWSETRERPLVRIYSYNLRYFQNKNSIPNSVIAELALRTLKVVVTVLMYVC